MFRLILLVFSLALAWLFDQDGGGSGAGGEGGNEGGPGNRGGGEEGRTFTQSQLDGIVGGRVGEARTAERNRIMQELGVEDLDSARQILEDRREADRLSQTELEQHRNDLATRTEERDQARQGYETLLVSSKLEGALRDAGINKGRIDAAVTLADRSNLSVVSGEVEGLDGVVTALTEGYPEWFEGSGNDETGQQQRQRQHGAADASGQTTGGGKPRDLEEALKAHYGG